MRELLEDKSYRYITLKVLRDFNVESNLQYASSKYIVRELFILSLVGSAKVPMLLLRVREPGKKGDKETSLHARLLYMW
jgi:hypothetical protein